MPRASACGADQFRFQLGRERGPKRSVVAAAQKPLAHVVDRRFERCEIETRLDRASIADVHQAAARTSFWPVKRKRMFIHAGGSDRSG